MIGITPLSDDLPFGARVAVRRQGECEDAAVRAQLNALFEDRGLIVFEGTSRRSRCSAR